MWKHLIVFNLIFLLNTSCNQDREDPLKCYSVINKNTGNPIAGVSMTIFVERGSARARWHDPYYGVTDANGKVCFDNTGRVAYYDLRKEGYLWICNSSNFSEPIELTPVAILKLHIQDEAPPANYRLLAVQVYRPIHCGSPGLLLWEDEDTNMDIIEIIHLKPGEGSISWSWWHANIKYESDLHMLNLTSGDTTNFEILY